MNFDTDYVTIDDRAGESVPRSAATISGMSVDDTPELSPVAWVAGQTKQILESGTTASVDVLDREVVLFTVRGARTGKLRYVPLMRVEHDGSYALIASRGGAPEHPAWYGNVLADPHVRMQDGTQTADYVARELHGDERAVWWERAVTAYPPYTEYQESTDRIIPVLLAEPAAAV